MLDRSNLNELQTEKLNLAAKMLKQTAHLFNENKSLLPLWGAGIITHGIPKIKACEIGITEEAEKEIKENRTKDHLFRVTQTANVIINEINNNDITVEEIEDLLLQRSSLMITTRNENNTILKEALKKCTNKDDWTELYKLAKIKYRLY